MAAVTVFERFAGIIDARSEAGLPIEEKGQMYRKGETKGFSACLTADLRQDLFVIQERARSAEKIFQQAVDDLREMLARNEEKQHKDFESLQQRFQVLEKRLDSIEQILQ